MSHSPAWNSEEKRNDHRLRQGTSRDRQTINVGVPPGRHYRSGGYKDNNFKDRGVEGRRHNRHRQTENEVNYAGHRNPGINFESHVCVRDDGLMNPPRKTWPGPPSLHSSTPSPIPPHRLSGGGNRKKEDREALARKSPEVGSKLEENREDDSVSYVAAGTAPVGSFRNGSSPVPVKSASPVPMPLVTNFAGQVLTTMNRAYPPGFEEQFDRCTTISNEQKSQYTSPNERRSRNGREKRMNDVEHGNRHMGNFFPNNDERQVINNQLAEISALQHLQSNIRHGKDMRMHDRYSENRNLLERKRDRRTPDEERRRNYPIPGRSVQRYAGDDHGMLSTATYRSAKNGRGDLPNVSSDDVVPTLMKFMQQQSSTVEHDEENGLSKLNSWPAVGPRAGDESSENTSPTLPVSPLKQNYSAVVARSSRSSTTDVPKDSPMLYSKKAATNLHPSTSVEEKDALLEKPPGSSSPQTVSDSHSPKDNRVGSVLPVLAATAAAVASSKRHESTLNAPPRTQPPSPPPTTPVDTQGQFEVSKMDVLSEQIWHYHNSVTQTEAMLTRKLHLRDMLYYAISPIFPMCGLYVVGSSLNGFGNNSSDMDLCLMITNKDLDQKTDAVVVLNMILTTLSKLDWVANQHLILAKVPILRIKFSAPWQDITVDLNANNSVAIKNTHLLCYYSSFDWRIRPLVSAVKEWAKRKGINDANRSSFTSYSLVLMVIHYLQCGAEPAVLPSLQRLYPKRFHARVDVRTLNVTQPLQHPSEDWLYQDKATLGELLIGFLDYYANKFDYNRDAISVREGKRVERAVMARHRPSGVPSTNHWRSQWRCICIEEPFTLSNTAHSIYDEMVFDAIKNAFREAHDELERNRDLNALLDCKPISVSLPHNGAVVYACDNSAATTDSSNVPSPELLCSSSNSSLNTAMTRSSSSVDSASSEEQKESQPDRSRRKRQGQQTRKPSTSSTTVVTPQ